MGSIHIDRTFTAALNFGLRTMSQLERPKVLVISELYPNPAYPAFGIFVERQTTYTASYVDFTVVAPVRVFPHLKLWKSLPSPTQFFHHWQQWRQELIKIPQEMNWNGITTYYPRYTSLPIQIFHCTWGYTGYIFLQSLLKQLYAQHKFDLIHAHYAIPCGTIALLAQRWMKCPIIVSVHGMDVTYTVHQHAFAAKVVKSVFERSDRVIVQSDWTAKQVQKFGASPEKISLVRLGANPPPKYMKQIDTTQDDVVRLLTVAYLEERKQQALVIEAVHRLIIKGRKVHYTIVGSGPNLGRLQELVTKLNLENYVSFEGYKTHDEVWPYFAQCDIFVMPSVQEAFGVVYIEALSMGKPAIGCKNEGGPEDIKRLGDCMILIEPNNVVSLENALLELIDHPEQRYRMGEIGKHVVQTYYDWAKNARELVNVYQELL